MNIASSIALGRCLGLICQQIERANFHLPTSLKIHRKSTHERAIRSKAQFNRLQHECDARREVGRQETLGLSRQYSKKLLSSIRYKYESITHSTGTRKKGRRSNYKIQNYHRVVRRIRRNSQTDHQMVENQK